MIEIERKFLVKNTDFINESTPSYSIKQGYLNSDPNRTVRVRTIKSKIGRYKNGLAFITIKGISDDTGLSRFEWEKEIPYDEALELMELCEGIIEKTRYTIFQDDVTSYFEVDIFEGNSKGLIVAEIELSSEDSYFERPDWLGKEVTGDVKYYNSSLMKNPYKNW